jgi:outer membrane protein assembly factor BamB
LGVVVLVWVAGWEAANAAAAEEPGSDASPAASDWPTFLGPAGDGKSPEVGLYTNWPKNGPKVLWQRKIGTSYGIGSVGKGRFYQFDRHGDQARLSCLDARSGEEIWRFEYPTQYEDTYGYNGGPRCSPVIDEDRIYLYGVEGMLYCVSAAEGKAIWHVDTAKDFGVVQNFFGVGSTPVVEGRLLLVMVGGSDARSQRVARGQLDKVVGNGTGIVAFDKNSGATVYTTSDELAGYASLKLATIAGRRWCFAFARGGLIGFDPANGNIDFRYPWRAKLLESVNASTPVVVGDEVFISETYGPGSSLLKVRPGGYQVVWRDERRSREKAMQTHWNTPIYHEGYLYGCSGRHAYNAELRCLEWQTGKVMWSVPGLTRTSLMYADGSFVCLGEYGQLLVFKANPQRFEPLAFMGEEGWKDEAGEALLDYPCWAAPILSHRLLYVRGRDRLVCLDLRPESYR